jgi:two-component system, LytTR family, response regulator
MEKFNCLIIEDEPLAADVLTNFIQQIPFLELKGVASDGLFALEMMKTATIDVLFLDIHLPKIRGLDFLRTLKSPPQVIITTAFREYALDGYEFNVVDYLLKPFSFGRFVSAVNKLRERNNIAPLPVATAPTTERRFILININKKKIKVHLDEILFIESKKEYISIVTPSETYLTKYQLADLESELDRLEFIRVHRSFIVPKGRIRAFTSTEVEVNGVKIPIGRSYKEVVMDILEGKK